MKILPAIRKQLIPLSREIPAVGSQVLVLVKNDLDGDYFVVGDVEHSMYCTEERTATTTGFSYVVRETPKRLTRKSYPYVDLHNHRHITEGKYLTLIKP
jgi:hypothetical protein